MELKKLNNFLEVLKDSKNLKGEFSALSLIEQLNKYGKLFETELKGNLLTIPEDKKEMYCEYIVESITNIGFDPSLSKIKAQFYLDEYESNFEEIESLEIESIPFSNLLTGFYHQFKYPREKELAFDCQHTFVNYYAAKNIQKILAICKNETPITRNQKNINNKIFHPTSSTAPEWFLETLSDSGKLDEEQNAKRGFQAIANAIFKNSQCKEHIFKYGLQLNEYIDYLNETFSAKINSTKDLSDGTKHENFVSKKIVAFLKSNK